MPPLTRRRLLQSAAAGGLAGASGCGGVLDGLPFGDDGIRAPYTNPSYTGSYTGEGRWPMAGHDAGRTGATAATVPDGDVGVAWLRQPGPNQPTTLAPVVGPDRVFVATGGTASGPGTSDDGPVVLIHGLDPETGERRFEATLPGDRSMGVAVLDELVVVATSVPNSPQARLLGVAQSDGAVEWNELVPGVSGPPAVADGTIYLTTAFGDHTVSAYGLDGSRLWRTPVDGGRTAPCVGPDRVYVGADGRRVAALDRATGDVVWTEQVATQVDRGTHITDTPVVADGRLYVPGIDSALVAVDAADGSELWRTTVVEEGGQWMIPSPAVTDETAYAETFHGGLVALDVADGSIRWRAADGAERPPAAGDGGVVLPEDDAVTAYGTDERRSWAVELRIPEANGLAAYHMGTEIALGHGMVYASVADGRVYAFGGRE